MTVKDIILREIQRKDCSTAQLEELGFHRDTIQRRTKELVEEGLVFRRGRGSKTYYTAKPKGEFPTKKERPLLLPDLPPLMLWWGGYTDKVPDPMAGEFVEGGQW